MAPLMTPKTVTSWYARSYIVGNNSRLQSVDNWEAFIGVGFGWGVGFCTLYLM